MNNKKWGVYTSDKSRQTHVMPVNDIVEHIESLKCPCKPQNDWIVGHLVIHNSVSGEHR